MTNDELATQFRALLDDLHDKIEALGDGAIKVGARRLAGIAHRSLEALRDLGADNNMVQPLSGGDPKP